ncbi:UNVERIFIED_CONTAM: hypothetical protein FKN15_056168 [Acipenser sinensis]
MALVWGVFSWYTLVWGVFSWYTLVWGVFSWYTLVWGVFSWYTLVWGVFSWYTLVWGVFSCPPQVNLYSVEPYGGCELPAPGGQASLQVSASAHQTSRAPAVRHLPNLMPDLRLGTARNLRSPDCRTHCAHHVAVPLPGETLGDPCAPLTV